MKVSSNDRYTLKQLLAIFPALYPLPKSCIGQYITMETFNGSFVWQDPEAGNNYEILDGCLGLVQLLIRRLILTESLLNLNIK